MFCRYAVRRSPWLLPLVLLAALVLCTGRVRPALVRAEPPSPDLASVRVALLAQSTAYQATVPTLQLADLDPADVVAGQATVTFAPGVSKDEAAGRLAATGGSLLSAIPELNVYRVALPQGEAVADGIAALAGLPGAMRAEPLSRLHSDFRPNDPLYGPYQSYLPLIHAEQAWDMQQGDPRIIVAVVDSGVDVTHPDLAGQIWTNPKPGASGCGDDVHGCNFVDPRNVDPSCPNYDPAPVPNPDIRPYYFHGTFVAGVIGAVFNNGQGIAGISPHVTIMPVKVGDCRFPDDTALAQGILYAANNGAQVINLSIGGSCRGAPSYVLDAITQAERKGAVVVAAAGNDSLNCVESPASFDGVIAVGAVSQGGQARASFSNWGPQISVVAPGEKIIGTVPYRADHQPPNDYYMQQDGTSFATPMVSALAQLLLSQNNLLTPAMVRDLIEQGAVPLADGSTPGWAGAGRIDLAGSLRLVPAAFFGTVSNNGQPVPEGTAVQASVGRQACGQGTTYSNAGQSYYVAYVSPATATAGCGVAGAQVTFTIAGRPAGTGIWQPAAIPLALAVGSTQPVPAATPAAGTGGSVTYHAGWNLVAGPAGTIFTGVSGPIYTLQAEDGQYESLAAGGPAQAGLGYWAYFDQDTSVTLAPDGAQSASVPLPAGQYVMIGNPSGTHAVTVSGADGVLVYDPVRGQYTQATTLQPGQGAWAISATGGVAQLR